VEDELNGLSEEELFNSIAEHINLRQFSQIVAEINANEQLQDLITRVFNKRD